ncbi:hypothetical protein GIB67_019598 [Kingdonia uniflora]|uniref:Aminotransferase-like plant mobile domain-containing protein n=1 Tax=Kingdonia uniflora TaxID=39325 RepID=A0A7J7N142_9MAGN|nr:hypothetical protein GIB67_019598 [Kingdonia uniflora]
MQDLTMSLEDEEYDGTDDEEGSESDYSEARDFRKLIQPDGNGHLSTSVATTSARVRFKCRSVLVKLREVYLILIEWPTTHTFHLPCGELGITPRDFTVLTGIAGWIEAQHYIVGHHVDYDAYWRHVSHGALMSDIAGSGNIDIPGLGYDFFTMTEGMWKLTLDRTLDLEARHLRDESRIIHLTADLRCAEGRLSQLNDYLDREGIVVYWEDDEGEAGTSQAGTSRGRGSRGRTSEGGDNPPRRSRRTRGRTSLIKCCMGIL